MRIRSILAAVLLLCAGGFLALAIERVVQRHHAPVSINAAMHDVLMSRLDSAVDLTPAQEDSIQQIFHRHQSVADSAWTAVNSRLHATMDSIQHEIERVLEPHQVAPFRAWVRHNHGSAHMR